MFRDFDYIAAIAYNAERETAGGPAYADLAESERMQQVERVMAIARSSGIVTSDPSEPDVFQAVVRTVWDHNEGQGGLALERIVHLGQVMVDLELVDPAKAAGRDMVECATELLAELKERKDKPEYRSWRDNPRHSALRFAGNRCSRFVVQEKGEPTPEPVVDQAAVFLEFLQRPAQDPESRELALGRAIDIADDKVRASSVVLVAEDLFQFLEPPAVEPAVTAELEDSTIQ